MIETRLCRASCVETAATLRVVAVDDPAELVTHLVLWLCSLVVIACGFARLLF